MTKSELEHIWYSVTSALENEFRARGWLPPQADRIAVLEAELDKKEEALQKIESWSRAYPLDIFPEPDWKKARALLEAGGITLDSVSAKCMRHVVEGVGKIARAALAPEQDK